MLLNNAMSAYMDSMVFFNKVRIGNLVDIGMIGELSRDYWKKRDIPITRRLNGEEKIFLSYILMYFLFLLAIFSSLFFLL